MATDITIPSLGESISEVVVSQWYKKNGEYVEKDEPLLELETDKVNQELPAPESGILSITAGEGDTLSIGGVAGSIAPGEKPSNGAAKAEARKQESAPAPEPQTKKEKAEAAPTDAESARASSVARKMAQEFGINLDNVKGTGPAGRITREDVEAAASGKPAAPAAKKETPPAAPAPAAGERRETRERMSSLRKKIAVRLVEAQHNAAMLTTINEVDMTAVMETRAKYKDAFAKKHGVGLGFMSFFVRAAVEALREYPRVNAYIDRDEIIYHHYQDIGVAVGTEKGLVVPVIRNAETLSFAGIEKAIRAYAEKARDGKLGLDDLTGGTFTISNGGVYGSMMSTPILNPPQSGILGMHNIIKRPVAINDQVVIRPMMYLALSYDHRIIDGKEAVGFLVRLKELIESPERMLLEI